jgi:maleylpyruvate isomerase
MIVYDYFRSSASFRLRIALNLKGLHAELRNVHLARGEQREAAFRDVNPQGFVPYLVDDDVALGQSLAIIEYLDERYPTSPLLPHDRIGRAQARQIALMVAADIHPLNNSRVLSYLDKTLKLDEAARTRWVCGWIQDGFAAIEALLQRRPQQTRFCVGDFPTIADICLIPQVTNAERFSCAMDAFPHIRGIYDQAMSMPAFADAHPAKQPGAAQ